MAGLNLLPWREAARKESQKKFVVMVVGAIVVAASTVFGVFSFYQDQINKQDNRNKYLQAEIKTLDKTIAEIKKLDVTRKALLDRITIIEGLQSTRPGIVHLFDEMVKSLPKGMYLTSLEQKKTKIKLEGKAESNARVSSYMNRLDMSPWLSSSALNIISIDTREKTDRLRNFSLSVTQLLKPGGEGDSDNGN
ncbi:PilN domain-containing protein [Leucothrix pacifica]|uniref:Pilus assembly protein PilN n=1 Tax=Leucothrix pacifica TaxID=1247513 RepID=A0A317CPT9_9GAMM|nr:PilN domain-containing protein [Leucothrix pacifica]PWR00465.1 pilus assembly protein PilN [Leucothrix pacifica]